MSSRICGQVLDSELSGNIRWVALAIADHADTDGECVMKLANVTRATRLSETTCRAMMRRMEDAGMLTIERSGGGRISLMKIHPERFDPSSSEGSKSEGSSSEGSSSEGSKEVVRFGKSQAESGLQDSGAVEAGANGSESRASAPSLPSPSSPLTLPLLSPNLSSPINPEVGEREDARGENPIPEQGTMFEEPEVSKSKPKKGPMVKPGKTEVMAFVLSMGLDPEDGEYIFENWEAGGWTRNGKPIKDWRACCRAWKAGRYFPSQKASTGRGGVLRGYRKIDYSKGF